MARYLVIIPNLPPSQFLDFGSTTVPTPTTQTIQVYGVDEFNTRQDITLTSIAFGSSAFSTTASIPHTILATDPPFSIPITFAPTVAGLQQTTATIGAGTPGQPVQNSPFVFNMKANAVTVGSISYTVTPAFYNWGTIKVGVPAVTVPAFIIRNTGSVNLIVNSFTPGIGDFAAGAVGLPATVIPGGIYSFTITATPSLLGAQAFPTGMVIATNGVSFNVQLGYNGVAVFSANILTGATRQLCQLGYQNTIPFSTPAGQFKFFDPTDLWPESNAFATKQHDFAEQSEYTYFNRLFMRLERIGPVKVTVQNVSSISGVVATSSDTKTLTPLVNDGLLDILIFDLENNGEVHAFTFSIARQDGINVGGGSFSMTRYVLAFEPRGALYEAS